MTPGRDDFDAGFPNASTGVLPVLPNGDGAGVPRNNAATAASAAGVRALSAQAIAFYFRAPVKAFFRTRVDYLAYARSVHQAQFAALAQAAASEHNASRFSVGLKHTWMWMRGTTPGLLTSVIQQHGWRVVPDQILPPLIANVTVGAVLYTSYLHILGNLHPESGRSTKRAYPPPEPSQTFTAGLLAGSLQSLVAAPLDAIQARYDHRDVLGTAGNGKPRSMWAFSAEKLREIGVRGVFAGWTLSLTKDSLGSAVFFSTFEYVKAQSYYKFVHWYYGELSEDIVNILARKRPTDKTSTSDDIAIYDEDSKHSSKRKKRNTTVIRPHYAIEPVFLLFAGMSASFAQQFVLHPLTHIQVRHWDHLEDLDAKVNRLRDSAAADPNKPHRRFRMLRAYYRAYQETFAWCKTEAAREGLGVTKYLYRGFLWNTIRQVPSTSAGLIIFELVRRKYGMGGEEVRISGDKYDILLH
ncbi:mitochondrial carrier domain-containing protein [Microdochium trichocladiopsis]|uniref:Mitochondrial carrier domain-containing protein n=1 Tax=Microdochium trichocladiopsis TaxID=1682393 RepID=A0A9P9C0R2_9PEZI|nr:mitochondrial carrier domain-containing protein [Microdochium trichocladiopsis]KAH7041369.1 mitochondrial carrier domain-containing protein [Microdochium trichocladiopsis]